MEPRTTLPLDILLYIIDLLAGEDEDDGDIKSLQILSQTCKSMVPLCRKHLFSSLCLSSKLDSERFSDLLSKNQYIARYVRSLNYRVYHPITDHELIIFDMLKERSSLQSIELSSPRLDWNNFPESIRSSLVSLIQLPTVTHLNIDSFKAFPATALSGCSNLIDLQLGELKLVPPEVNQVVSRSKIPTPISLYIRTETYGISTLLKSASPHAAGPIVDFSRLQKVSFDVKSRSDIGHFTRNGLIKVTARLEYFYIMMDRPVRLAGLGVSLAINAYRTLKLLSLSVIVIGDNYDPLCGLNHELKYIAGNNILEELELDVVVQVGVSHLTESEDWSAFDSVLTESDAFPMLHQVSVEIWWYSTRRDLSEQDPMLESLKEDRFPRLVESKAVQFNFCVEIQYDNE